MFLVSAGAANSLPHDQSGRWIVRPPDLTKVDGYDSRWAPDLGAPYAAKCFVSGSDGALDTLVAQTIQLSTRPDEAPPEFSWYASGVSL
jgi:hypothetical protein